MTKEEIGTVVSTMDGPSPSTMSFVVTNGMAHRGQFVELDYAEGTMVALVTDVIKTNRYFERAESVKEFETNGKALFEQFPVGEWEYLLAKTRPLGVFKDSMTKRASYPPSPGVKVRTASPKSLKRFLNFKEDGLHLGKLEYHDLDVKLNLTKLLQKHLAILAMSGAGKSVTAKVLIEEMLARNKEQGRLAIVVLDVHGEYTSFAEPVTKQKNKDYSNYCKVIKGKDIKIGMPKLSIGILSTIIPGLSSVQKRELDKVLSKLRQEMREGLGPFGLRELKNEIIKDPEIKDNTKQPLIGWLNHLDDLYLFSKIDSPSIYDVVKPGNLTIIDLSDIINMKKKQIIVSYFAQKLFTDRRNKKVPPFLLILEEAHQFIPERTGAESAISRSIMRTIAREGRKFGASLCLISQRPIQLDTTTLSQCNTQLIMRITNPYDLKHIGESAEGLDNKSLEMLTSLKVGEALLIGEAVNYPVFFKVRKNYSLDSKHEVTLEEAAKRFEKSKDEAATEAKEFL
jgi:DNA helicase HerA-like ATPase